MIVSVGAYTLLWGWRFAALFVALLFVHELGHAIALRHEGIATSPILFVPFLGAVIGMRGRPRNAWIEAKVGLAGPLLGSAGAAGVFALGACDELAAARGRGLHGLLPQPLQPAAGGSARRRPRSGRAAPARLARRHRRARGPGGLAPEPDPLPVPDHRRHGGVEAPARLACGGSRHRRVLPRDAQPADRRRGDLPRPGRRCSWSAWRSRTCASDGSHDVPRAPRGPVRCRRPPGQARARRPSAAWRPCRRGRRRPPGCSASGTSRC